MKLVDCRACGSKEMLEENGFVVCAYCQSRYLHDVGGTPVTSVPKCRVGPCEEAPKANSVYCSHHSTIKIVQKGRPSKNRL